MGSKYIDLGFALFLGYFAYTRVVNGQYGFATLFAVLSILNFSTAFMKHKRVLGQKKDEE
ncbi:hypothetical protein [Sporosarcina pasteurii]|uniref:Uncharacterized protein n=1 Tax=Sporosarcina pasteurii TaxID=1474 RepID=A0A380C8H6_SPOPA|nr:hypothetical protein [Sporosarcina pasteurii]MDS9473038.1 hypothetical protein [Sporosarcina pasteurii]QBQ04547.1 hypothetical protein E2C16_02100 [Sporosarcina pasteurii]SUJ14187.1 Uncharacterised protein [Sporosarcina pasteurii]